MGPCSGGAGLMGGAAVWYCCTMCAEAAKRAEDDPQGVEERRQAALEVSFLEAVRGRLGDDVPTLKALGDLYTKTGRVDDGLQTDLLLAGLCPDDGGVWYNLACSHSLKGTVEAGLQALARALERGYRDVEWMLRDPDLMALRRDPRFMELIGRPPPDGA